MKFVYVDWFPVVHAASGIFVRKNIAKKFVSKTKKERNTERKEVVMSNRGLMYYIQYASLHNSINSAEPRGK